MKVAVTAVSCVGIKSLNYPIIIAVIDMFVFGKSFELFLLKYVKGVGAFYNLR